MPPEINTEFDELAPFFSADGKKLYFSRRNHPRNFGQRNAEDIWIAYRQADGSWSRAVNAGAPLNGRGNNRLVGLNPNETHYYFLANALPDTTSVATGLFLSQREGRSLGPSAPVVIDGYSNLAAKADFHLGPDEEIMIMAIRMDDSYGIRDLYLSRRQPDGSWGKPRNLGGVINSSVDEGSPYLAADRRSLYFCRQVAGSLTFYLSRRTDDSWTKWTSPEVIPLPAELSGAPGPDFTLTPEGDAIILPVIDSSGQFDLYRVTLPLSLRPGPVVLITGEVKLPAGWTRPSPEIVFSRRSDPAAISGRMPVHSDRRFSFVADYGHNLVLYAQADPLFCPAECLTLSGMPCQVADQEQTRLIEELLGMPEYLESEQEILDLFQRRQRSFEQLTELDLRLHDFDALSSLDLPASVFDSVMANDAALRELAAVYQPRFREQSLMIKGVEDEGAEQDEQEMRFMKLRRRFREHLQAQRDTLEETALVTAAEAKPERFDVFCRQLWNYHNQQLTPAYRFRRERDELERQIELLEENRNTPSGLVAFLDQHRQNMLSTGAAVPVVKDIHYAEDWLNELYLRTAPIIRDALDKIIGEHLEKLAVTHVEQLILEFRRNREYTIIDQEFRSRMQKQMDLEKDLMDRLRTKGPASPPVTTPGEATPQGPVVGEQLLSLEEAVPNSSFLLPAVTFDANTATLQPGSLRELDRLAAFLAREPQLSVRILAHTHAYLTHFRARQLTAARARKVAEYLASRGINPRRLQPEGMGKMDPLDSNATAEGRARNQRLEIRLVYPLP